MLVVWDTPLFADVETILEDLGYRVNRRSGNNNIMFRCPFHKETHGSPSFGVSADTGLYHCFNPSCGAKGDIVSLVAYTLDTDLVGAWKWLIKRYHVIPAKDGGRPDLTSMIDSESKRGKEVSDIVPETILDQYAYRHPYIYKRKLTEDTALLFDLGYDKEADAIVIPWRDRRGSIAFIKKRPLGKTDKKYVNDAGVKKGKYLFGLWLIAGRRDIDYVYLVEGEFDAMYCVQNGLPAVALGGSEITKEQIRELHRAGVRKVILFLDNPLIDPAGKAGAEKIREELLGSFIVKRVIYPNATAKDANDLTEEEIKNLIVA